jgi:ankyrin repeat protein
MASRFTQEEIDRYHRLTAAFESGDFAALQAEFEPGSGFPNVEAHPGLGLCLIAAIYQSPVDLVRALLDAGADPNAEPGDGYPSLIAALTCAVSSPGARVRTDVHELMELLLSRGANPNQRGVNDYTPLHVAAEMGDLRAVELLLSHGADPNEVTRIDDLEAPVEVAEKAGHRAVAERLRPLTARLDWEKAVKDGDIKVLYRMVRGGHDINARDGLGQTALMRAAHAGGRDMVEWLIKMGAELNHASKANLSALMLAVISGHPQIARLLVAAGADVSIQGSGPPGFRGKTAADLAEERGDKRLAAYIRSASRE